MFAGLFFGRRSRAGGHFSRRNIVSCRKTQNGFGGMLVFYLGFLFGYVYIR